MRFFGRMPEDSTPQWISTLPEEGAPRTGEGVFSSEILEVVQVGGLALRRSFWSIEWTRLSFRRKSRPHYDRTTTVCV